MTTSDVSFEAIKEVVCKWVNGLEKRYSTGLSVERIKNEPDMYMAFIYLKNCGAQVIVNKPLWAPYRYVCFEVVSILDQIALPVFTWYDCDEDDVDSVIQQLQRGIEYAMNYTPAK